MKIITHEEINSKLCGTPVNVEPDFSRIELKTDDSMKVDKQGLVHGGFVFGLADYAAMLAVNDPNVVLGGADVKFLKPVKAGEKVVAEAKTTSKKGRKHIVFVTVHRNEETVFSGEFTCFILDKHVLL
ncbi:MAG: thioesterase [Desulfobacteraceae bacterium]|nr:thioesterase [Desulfobacteraceae bacterium]MBC2756526.1 thioesterase [Desulfobacteraceae bacterium]